MLPVDFHPDDLKFLEFLDAKVKAGRLTEEERREVTLVGAQIKAAAAEGNTPDTTRPAIYVHATFAMQNKLKEINPALAAEFQRSREIW